MKKNEQQEQIQPNNPLHGIKLKEVIEYLVKYYGWEELGELVNINCFRSNPSIGSMAMRISLQSNWIPYRIHSITPLS